jgi:parvulin-like peptidyl-prolyl isomerase
MKFINMLLLLLAFMLIVVIAVEYQFNRQVDLLSLIAANTQLVEDNRDMVMQNRELITKLIEMELGLYEGREL